MKTWKESKWRARWNTLSVAGGLLLGFRPAGAEAAPAGAAAPAEAATQAVPAGVAPNAAATPAWARAYAQGQWSVTAGLIETVSEGSRSPWHWLHLARAREKLGHLVEAFAAYERLLEMTTPPDSKPPTPRQLDASGFGEVRREAEAEAEALAQRIPWAQIDLGGEVPPGAYLFVDQQWLTPARVQSPYPVNPGWHTFLLESDGEVHAARRIHFEEGQNRQVILRRPLGGAASVSPHHDASGAGVTTGAEPSARASSSELKLAWSKDEPRLLEDTRRANLRLASYISLGVGVVGLGVGTGFTIAAIDKRNELIELNDTCQNRTCDGSGRAQALNAEIGHSSAIANLSFLVGGFALVTGGVLFLLQHGQSAKPATDVAGVELEPLVGLGAAGVSGRF
jgi:hypothetical protein